MLFEFFTQKKNSKYLDKAKKFLSESIRLAELFKDKKIIVRTKFMAGIFYYKSEEYAKSIKYYIEASKLKTDDYDYLAVYQGISTNFFELNEYDKALDSVNKLIERAVKIGDRMNEARGYKKKGLILHKMNYIKSARIYGTMATEIFEELKCKREMLNSYEVMGEIEKSTRHPKKAYKFYKEAKRLAAYLQDYIRASSIGAKLSLKKLTLPKED